MLAYMFTRESCLLVCHQCFNTMKLWTFDPNLHFSLMDTTFCLLFFVCLTSCLFACFLVLCLPCLSCLSALRLLHMHFASFSSIACLLVSCLCLCLCLCMYTHGARTLRARAQSPKSKQKGRRCMQMDISQAAMFSRFRSLAFPFWFCTL